MVSVEEGREVGGQGGRGIRNPAICIAVCKASRRLEN